MSNSLEILDDKFELAPEQSVRMHPMTLATLIAQFLALTEFSPATRECYKGDLKKLWDFTKGDLSDTSLMRFKAEVIDDKTLSSRTANRLLVSTRRFLDYLIHLRIMQTNAYANKFMGKGKKVDKHDSPYVALNDAEVRKMIDYPDRSTFLGSSQRISLVLGFYLGLRVSEICGIRYDSISNDGVLTVHGKGNKTRTIPLTETLLNEINDHIALMALKGGDAYPERHLVETRESQGRMADTCTVWRWFTSIAKSVGIEKKFTPHSARATAITKALDSGVGIRDVAILAGHSSVDTTSIYDKRRGEAAKKTVQAIKY